MFLYSVGRNPGERLVQSPDGTDKDSQVSFLNSRLFLLSMMQYWLIALLSSEGKPFRQAIHKNVPFVCCLAFFLAANLFILFGGQEWIAWILSLVGSQEQARHGPLESWVILFVSMLHLNASLLTEHVLAPLLVRFITFCFAPQKYSVHRQIDLMQQQSKRPHQYKELKVQTSLQVDKSHGLSV